MLDKEPTKKSKKNLIILDFDGTLFFSKSQNFSVALPLEDILRARHFFSEFMYQSGVLVPKDTEFALITGRHRDQEGVILYLLRAFGYKIDLSYFNQLERTSEISENEFLIRYWTEKVKLIDQIRESKEYRSIIVIDDSKIICSMLRKLDFEVYRAKITKQYNKQNLSQPLNQALSVSFSRSNGSRAAKLQNLYERHQNRKFIAKGILT